MKRWRWYTILVRGFGGWPSPDDRPGYQERYSTRKEATERASLLWATGQEPFVEVHEMTDEMIASWPMGQREGYDGDYRCGVS